MCYLTARSFFQVPYAHTEQYRPPRKNYLFLVTCWQDFLLACEVNFPSWCQVASTTEKKSFPCTLKLHVRGKHSYRQWQGAQIRKSAELFGTGRVCQELTDTWALWQFSAVGGAVPHLFFFPGNTRIHITKMITFFTPLMRITEHRIWQHKFWKI